MQLFIPRDLRNVYAKLENANCLRFFIPQALEGRTPASNKTEDDSTTDAKQKQTCKKEALDSKKAKINKNYQRLYILVIKTGTDCTDSPAK